MDIETLEKIKTQLEPKEMAGLILLEFEKNKYCATQISTVLNLLMKAYHQYKDIQPIEFNDSAGECELIQLYKEHLNITDGGEERRVLHGRSLVHDGKAVR